MAGKNEVHVLRLHGEALVAGLAHMRERNNEVALVLVAQDTRHKVGNDDKILVDHTVARYARKRVNPVSRDEPHQSNADASAFDDVPL